MLEKSQFRILFREFLFNMIDLEILSAQAYGDMSKLLGQFAALLLWLSGMLLLGGAMTKSYPRAEMYWPAEHSFVALTMLIVGIFMILSWDSALPNRRDVLVLSPLPIRVHTLFAAKVAALATSLSLTVVAVHALACLTWVPHFMPAGTGFVGLLRTFAAYWVAMFSAGAFIFCCLLGLQGLAAQLPRPLYLRLSSLLQMAAFCTLLCGYFLEPRMGTPGAIAFAPAYWFFAVFHQLLGTAHPSMGAAAQHAWLGLIIAALVAAGSFLLSYFRTVKMIVEEPDITPAVRGVSWLPRFGGLLDTAITHFSIRTLLRTRQHRVILAFYLGIGFAVLTLGIRAPHGRAPATTLFDVMVASAITMSACVIGVRVVFGMPIDLRANWVFRLTEVHSVGQYLSAGRRPLFVLAVMPVWLAAAAATLYVGPWQFAARHLVVLALWGAILAYLSLYNFHKIPFTCSYLPGKSQVHLAIISGMALLMLTTAGSAYEFGAFLRPRAYAVLVGCMFAVALGARSLTVASSHSGEAEVQFEESLPPAVLELNIRKDGYLPLT